MTDVQKGRWLVAGQFVLFALLLLLPRGADWEARGVALAEAIGSLAFLAAAMSFWGLGRARAANPVPNAGGSLVVAGAFRLVRHPTYSFLLLAFLAIASRSQSWAHVALWLALVALFNVKARFEERLLAAKFGDYEEYAARTGRFLPRWRRSAL